MTTLTIFRIPNHRCNLPWMCHSDNSSLPNSLRIAPLDVSRTSSAEIAEETVRRCNPGCTVVVDADFGRWYITKSERC